MTLLTACGQVHVPVHLPGGQQTLDSDGGLRLKLSLSCPVAQAGCDIPGLSVQTRAILKQRAVDGLGVAAAATHFDGATGIEVDLPGYTNEAQARAVLGARGEVDVVDLIDHPGVFLPVGKDISTQMCNTHCTSDQYAIVFTGAQIASETLSAVIDEQTSQPVVRFAFARQYQQQFADYTLQHIGQYLTIVLDGIVIESATIQSEIQSEGQITGLPTLENAQALVTKLKYRALPLEVTSTSVERVSPAAQK